MNERIIQVNELGQNEFTQFFSVDIKAIDGKVEIPTSEEVSSFLYDRGYYGGVIHRLVCRGDVLTVVIKAYKE